MWNHTKAKHPEKLVSKSTAIRCGNSGAEGKGEASDLMRFGVTQTKLPKPTARQYSIAVGVAEMTFLDFQQFCIVDDIGFKRFVHLLGPAAILFAVSYTLSHTWCTSSQLQPERLPAVGVVFSTYRERDGFYHRQPTLYS